MNAIERLKRIARNIRDFQASLPEIVLDSVRENEGKVLDLVRDEQLTAKGIDGSGRAIRPKYTRFTVSIKREKGQETGHVTLRDTGETQDTMIMEYGAASFYPVATTPQVAKLQRKYGDRIFDLTDKSVDDATKLMRNDIFDKSIKMIFR